MILSSILSPICYGMDLTTQPLIGERPIIAEFQKFSRLSSVSINSDDSKLLASEG